MHAATDLEFTTAAAPALALDGVYTWTVQFPAIDFANQSFDFDSPLPTVATITATARPGGADLAIDYGQGFVLTVPAVIDGSTLHMPPVPIAVGGSGVDGHATTIELVDDDADGVADRAEGQVEFSGPGMPDARIAWDLRRPLDPNACEEQAVGDVMVDVTLGDGATQIAWGEAEALALFVTDPQAVTPQGPGMPVEGGATYWSLQLVSFPDGFLGPVTYGEVPAGAEDSTEISGDMGPGATPLAAGGCYKFSVFTTDFKVGSRTLRLP